MEYTNSPLVNYTKLSPNNSGLRNHCIDTITIHCVVGQCSVETLGNIFAPESRQASSNYGVGVDGRIGLYCEEKNRSWCSSSASNDHRAITIEVASDTTHPYAVNAKAYAALIDLVTDICKRNGIKQLLWKGDKSLIGQVDKQNMTVHRWFANKSCPGDYLYNRHGEIAAEVNKRLNAAVTPEKPASGVLYRVQVGAYSVRGNADAQLAKVKAAGFDTYMVQVGGLFKIQVGAYSVKSNADNMLNKLKAAGFDGFITTTSGTAVGSGTPAAPAVVSLSVGDKVKMTVNAPVYGKTGTFASWVYASTLYVREISGSRIVISTQRTGAITGAVDKKYLTKI
ncbi:MAG: cell division protein [Clostridia bacterium]|nr:cell division protein [Clostridia bacterium]